MSRRRRIQPKATVELETVTLRLPAQLVRAADQYAKYLGGSTDRTHVVTQALEIALAQDVEFQRNLATRPAAAEAARVRRLRDELWWWLLASVPGLALNGNPTERLPNTLNVRFPGVSGAAVLEGATGVAASTGSACHDGREEAPAVIVAMRVPRQEALGSVRLTLGRGTTRDAVERAATALATSWRALGSAPNP